MPNISFGDITTTAFSELSPSNFWWLSVVFSHELFKPINGVVSSFPFSVSWVNESK